MFKLNVKNAVVAAVGVIASAGAFAQVSVSTYATPQDALNALSGTANGFGPVLFGMAVVSSGIVLGISWIKKSRSAAK